MPRKPNTKMIGLFVVSGIVAVIVILAGYISSTLMPNKRDTVVMYFDESVRGLNVGSSVVFNGVEIGKISKIELITNSDDTSFRIPVYATLTEYKSTLSRKSYHSRKELLNKLIEKGLRARLGIQNYITGQLIVELVILPDSPIVLKYQGENDDILEIPTVLSPIKEISQDLSKVQLSAVIANISVVCSKLNQEMPNILPQVTRTFRETGDLVETNSQAIRATIRNMNDAAVSIKQAGDSLRNLTDYLERHPESIVRGKEK